MPDPVNPLGRFDLGFQEQIDFFRSKLSLGTQAWTDIWESAHDRSFVVAGAMKADLLNEIRQSVDKAIATGTTLETFRKEFRDITDRLGWPGKAGQGTTGGFNWRTKVIYETNLRTSYAAGREAQLADPGLQKLLPFRRYVHNDSVLHPRPQHLAWNGLTLPHDHEFWKTHSPPNGWGCRCRVTAVPAPRKGDATKPPAGWEAMDEKTGAPVGIDKGWGYAPGKNTTTPLKDIIDQKLIRLDAPIGAAMMEALRPALAMESQAKWWQTLDAWLADPVPRGRSEIVGVLSPRTIAWLETHGFQVPDSAEIAIEDRLVVGAKQRRHEKAQNALLPEEWRALTRLLDTPSGVYLDTHSGKLVFVADGIGPEKAAVEFDPRSNEPINLVDSAFRVSAVDVAGAVKGNQWLVVMQ